MKKLSENKGLFAAVFFVLGFFSFWGGQSLWNHFQAAKPKPHTLSQQFPGFPGSIFRDDEEEEFAQDPFEHMRRLQQQMLQGMQQPGSGFEDGSAGEITTREDDKNIYYDISIEGVDMSKLKVDIKNGMISISGEAEQKSEDSSQPSYFKSEFHRSFPVPPNADADKVRAENSKDKLTIVFPKKEF